MIKSFSIDGEIVHENFHDFLDHVCKDRHHAPLKRCGSVTKPERHPVISIGSVWASKRGLALIIRVDGNLVLTGIPIKEIEERMLGQPL